MAIDWKKLCADSHRIAKDKGWLEKPRSFDGDIALMHSEISEALEDYRTHRGLNEIYYEDKKGNKYPTLEVAKAASQGPFKPCGIPIEFADYVIRIAQYCGSNHVDLPYAMHLIKPQPFPSDFEKLCAMLHLRTSLVYDDWLPKEDTGVLGVSENAFARSLSILFEFCGHHKIDLEGAIAMKQAYNEGREYRHGGKKI